jgi:hypothetical protein
MDQFQYSAVNLKDVYNNYSDKVKKLEKAGEDAKWQSQTMQEGMSMYIQNWQNEMGKVSDPAVKSNLAARQEAVKANAEAIKAAAADARTAYDPFLRDCKDIQHALSINLSQAALPGLKGTMERAHSEGAVLKEKLAAMQQVMTNIERGLTPAGTPAM